MTVDNNALQGKKTQCNINKNNGLGIEAAAREVRYKALLESEANFILIKVDDANKRYEELIKNGIVVRNRSSQLHCENCLRITVGTPSENTQLITLLKTLI